jgi:hypothetical protein
MSYSILATLGNGSTWLARRIISATHDLEIAGSRIEIWGGVEVDFGSFFLFGKKILVYPISPGFRKRNEINDLKGRMRNAERMIGIGWCGCERRDVSLGSIVVPGKIYLSDEIRKKHGLERNYASPNRRLRHEIIEELGKRGLKTVDRNLRTCENPREKTADGMLFQDMESGLLVDLGNQYGIPASCACLVSDYPAERIFHIKREERRRIFMERILSSPVKIPFEKLLAALLEMLRK